MTALVTLLVIALASYLMHYFGPKRSERTFAPHRFRPSGSLTDRSPTYYDEQRRYSDLAAIYGRDYLPDPDFAGPGAPRRAATSSPGNRVPEAKTVQLRKTGLIGANVSVAGGTLAV
ncbi:hypothetical protein [Nocardia australiensis]|uniref:hypothetical protein n=1 Tax=Nocardia australiensis TaxID=2887191 RepID=UPI001D1340BF|nr:hypothetical protein [Nocardia australiensis]